MKTIQTRQGFTLIELMITMAVIAILSAVALPSYQFAMRNARRAEAKGCLMELQNFMERFLTLNGSYKCVQVQTPTCTAADADPVLPFDEAPKDGAKAYDLTLQVANDGNSYTLTATPKSGTGQAGDGSIELDSTGARRWDRNGDGSFSTAEQNWNR